MEKSIATLRAKYWGNQPGTIFSRTNKAKIASPLMLAQAHVLADLACRLRNRMKMYAAGPAATAALKREADQAESDAREALRGAYGR